MKKIIIYLCVVVYLCLPALALAAQSGIEVDLISLTNESRAKEGLPLLAINPVLTRVAHDKATDMAINHYFAHTSPSGLSPWYWFNKQQYRYLYAGENLAIGFREGEDIHSAWLNSPSHKANILSNRFTEIGVATVKGTYKKKATMFVVMVYGTPR